MTISVLARPLLEPVGSTGGLKLEYGDIPTKISRRRDQDLKRPRIERRRSDRVHPGRALAAELLGVGPSRVISLSLGGATLETATRIEAGVSDRLLVEYGDRSVEIDVVTYHTSVKELFYAANGLSWICYRSHAVFQEPSVPALNLVYRIIADHWVAPEDDDTRPASG